MSIDATAGGSRASNGTPCGLTRIERNALRRAHARSRRRQTAISMFMLAPLLVFVGLFFVIPLANMLYRSVDNREVALALPQTAQALRSWQAGPLPNEDSFRALTDDLIKARDRDRSILGNAAKRLNLEVDGFRSLLLSSAAKMKAVMAPYKEGVIAADSRWGEERYWRVLLRNATPVTGFYYLTAFDLKQDMDSSIVAADQPIFVAVFIRSAVIGLVVTGICLLLGYPLAFLLASASARVSGVLMFLVMLPFWTSILVRTSSWIVLLQKEGPINQVLQWLGMIGAPLPLLFSRSGVIIAMVHVMLPFMVLPIYSVMKGVNPNLMRAAQSLGAHNFIAFRRIYLPQTMSGIAAGTTLVFILTIGYYITPQLIGGPKDQLISGLISSYTSEYLNWGLASALSSILLLLVFAGFFSLRRHAAFGGLS